MINLPAWLFAATSAWVLCCAWAHAEQLQRFGDWEVHYVVLPSGFLKPDVAAGYHIVRGRDRAFVNVSVLDPDGQPSKVDISGHSTNLLELFGMMGEILGVEAEPEHAPARVGDVLHSQADISLARELLGYEPMMSLEDGLKDAVAYYETLLAAKAPGS